MRVWPCGPKASEEASAARATTLCALAPIPVDAADFIRKPGELNPAGLSTARPEPKCRMKLCVLTSPADNLAKIDAAAHSAPGLLSNDRVFLKLFLRVGGR